jgi:hypothetical protein
LHQGHRAARRNDQPKQADQPQPTHPRTSPSHGRKLPEPQPPSQTKLESNLKFA